MKTDAQATREARRSHAEGVRALNASFGYVIGSYTGNRQTGRARKHKRFHP